MDCYYYIKLANGGEIRLPANFVPLVNTDKDLMDLINKYQKSLTEESTEKHKEDLKKYLTAGETGLHTSTIESLLKKHAQNHLEVSADANDFLEMVNEKLAQNGSVKDFYKILRGKTWNNKENYAYTSKEGNSKDITTKEFLALLKQPVRLKYLDSVKSIGILGIHSIKDIKENLKAQEALKIDVGSNPIIEESLLKLLTGTFNINLFKKDSFYALDYSGKAGDSMVIHPTDSTDPIIFYNKDNPISLYMSIYKYLASEISPKNLAELIKIYNEENKTTLELPKTQEDVRHFFNGSFTDGVYIEGEFESLTRSKSGTTFMTNELLEGILSTWEGELSKTAINNIRRSVFKLTPYVSKSKAYISEFGKFIEEEADFFKKEVTHARTWLKNNFDIVNRYLSDKDYYYSENKEVSFESIEDAYAWLDSNINYKQDIIKLKRGGIDTFVIPTDFVQKGNSIQVQGFTQKKGKFESLGETEDLDLEDIKKIVYRTLDSKDPGTGELIANDGKDAIVVYVDKEKEGHSAVLAPSIIKETARIGSKITYLKADGGISYDTVTEVLPAGLRGKRYLIKFNKITSISTDKNFYIDSEFTDAEAEQKLKVLNKYKKINQKTGNFMYAETGDLIVQTGDTRKYNKVVGVHGNIAYILIKSTIKENGDATENFQYRVSGVKRSDIGELYKKTVYAPKLPLEVGEALIDFKDNKSLKTHNFSFFDNYGEARNGDYFLLNNNTYQIIDREHNIFAKFTVEGGRMALDYSQLNDINENDAVFVTNRNISSKFADKVNELNNKHLHITKPPGKKGVVAKEAVYILPKNVDIEETQLLDSGSLNLGYSAEKSYIESVGLSADEKDVTKEVAEKIAEKTGVESNGKLWINTKGRYFTKYNAKLFQTKFADLSEDNKAKYIQNNSFIFFKNSTEDANLRNKTFRVANISDEKLSLEYNRYSRTGEMVTIKKSVNKEQAFKDIEWLYLYRGNSRIPELQRAQDKRTKKNRRDEVGNIALTFAKVFGMETTVIKTSPKGKATKKAWIAVKANPKVVINLGNENTDESDLVHEYMHLFLFALKTKKLPIYENLLYEFRDKKINNIVDIAKKTKKMQSDLEGLKSGDLTTIEELLVEELSLFMAGQLDYAALSEDAFIASFSEAVKELGYEEIDLDVGMFDILGMKMGDIFTNVESKLVKDGLVMFEANFRKWITEEIENNDMKLNCG